MNEQDPNDIRAQLLASLQQRMAPVAQPDTSAQDEAARKANQDAMMIRSGVQLGQAFLGNAKSDGDNLYSQSLEGDAKSQLAQAMEAKRMAAEQDKRREELRNGLSTRFVDDDNLRTRTAEDRKNKDSDYARKLKDDREDQERTFRQQKELAELNNKGKLSVSESKAAGKTDKVSMLSDKQIDSLQSYEDSLDLIGRIKTQKPTQDTGPVASFLNKTGQAVGIDDPKTSAFRGLVQTQLANYIKDMSGAAASDKERAFLMENQPNFQDNDATFNEKLANLEEYIKGKQQNKLVMLGGAGKNVSGVQPKERGDVVAPGQEAGGLSKDEQAELDALEKQYGGK